MSMLVQVCDELLWIYRERFGRPEFWAEPLNAMTNASFLFAAAAAMHLARQRAAATRATVGLVSLAGVIGLGSFYFHTVPNRLTMWLDIAPIALFQIAFLWLATRQMLRLRRTTAFLVITCVLGTSFALLRFHEPMNGSLFYLPSFLTMLVIGVVWVDHSRSEPYLLAGAACVFALAVTARTVDWIVPWKFGTHFLWHLLNGVVVYLVLRAWIGFVEPKEQSGSDSTVSNNRSRKAALLQSKTL